MIQPWPIYSNRRTRDTLPLFKVHFSGQPLYLLVPLLLLLVPLLLVNCSKKPAEQTGRAEPLRTESPSAPAAPSLAERLNFPPLLITLPQNLKPLWQEILRENPPPPACPLSLTNRQVSPQIEKKALHLQLYTRSWQLPAPPDTAESTPNPLILQTRYYAPAAPMDSPRESISARSLLYGQPPEDIRILPLSEITPPFRALPVDSLLPGDPGYPLKEEICLAIHYPPAFPSVRIPRAAEDWLSSLYQPPQPPQLLRLVLTGPIRAYQSLQDRMILNEDPLPVIFRETRGILQSADLAASSFFGCVTSRSRRYTRGPVFRSDQRILPILRNAGFDYLSSLSRDSLIFGAAGFEDHLGYMKKYGLTTGGTRYLNPEETTFPPACSFTFPSMDITITSRLHPAARAERTLLTRFSGKSSLQILTQKALPPPSDPPRTSSSPTFAVTILQTSQPLSPPFSPALRRTFRHHSAEADLVLGSWPGPAGGMSLHEGTPLIYNLGTFLGGTAASSAEAFPLLLTLTFLNGRPLYWDFRSLRRGNREIDIDPQRRGEKLFWTKSRLAAP